MKKRKDEPRVMNNEYVSAIALRLQAYAKLIMVAETAAQFRHRQMQIHEQALLLFRIPESLIDYSFERLIARVEQARREEERYQQKNETTGARKRTGNKRGSTSGRRGQA